MGGFLPDFWSIDFEKLDPTELELLKNRLEKELELAQIKIAQLEKLLERVKNRTG